MNYDYEIVKKDGARYSYKIVEGKVVCFVNDVKWRIPQGEKFIKALLLELIEKDK